MSTEHATSLPHTHNWEIIAKTYGAPRQQTEGVNEKALFGVTTLLWECSVCRELRKEEVLGTDENQLLELLLKVDTLGPQIVRQDGSVYVISKYVPPTQQPGNIPLR